MKLVKTEFEVDVYGTKVTLSEPNMRTVQGFQKKMSEDGADEVDLMLDFLAECGLERKISEEMSPNHVSQVMEALVPKSK